MGEKEPYLSIGKPIQQFVTLEEVIENYNSTFNNPTHSQLYDAEKANQHNQAHTISVHGFTFTKFQSHVISYLKSIYLGKDLIDIVYKLQATQVSEFQEALEQFINHEITFEQLVSPFVQ